MHVSFNKLHIFFYILYKKTWLDVRFVLDQHVELDFYRAIYSSLKQHSTSGHVVLLAYVILIPIKAYFLVLRS
jgi:hypothetical protein